MGDYRELTAIFDAQTSGATTTQELTISGIGSDCIGAEFKVARASSLDTLTAHSSLSIGMTDGTRERCCAVKSKNGQTTTSARRHSYDDRVISIIDDDDNEDGVASFDSFITDGVRIDWSDYPAGAYKIMVTFIVSSTEICYVNHTSITGANSGVTGLPLSGRRPDIARCLGMGNTFNSSSNEWILHYGIAVRGTDGAVQECCSWFGEMPRNGQNPSKSYCKITDQEIAGQAHANSITWEIDFSSFDVNGFTTAGDNNSDHMAYMLCTLPSDQSAHVGLYQTKTTTGTQDYPGTALSFTPGSVALIGSSLDTANTLLTSDTINGSLTFAHYDGTRICGVGVHERDGVSPSDCDSHASTSAFRCYRYEKSAAYVVDGFTPTANKVTFDYDAAHITARYFVALFVEESVTDQDISPGGIASAEALGTAVLSSTVDVAPGSITSGEAFGSASVDVGDSDLSPTGIASGEAFGDASVDVGEVELVPGGIPSEEAFGDVVVSSTVDVAPSGIASSEAVGDTDVSTGFVDISPTGIVSDEAVGEPSVDVGVAGIAPEGVASDEAVESPVVSSSYDIDVGGIATAEAMGDPVVDVGAVDVAPGSIVSSEALGDHEVSAGAQIQPGGVASGESVGDPTVSAGAVDVSPDGVASAEALGDPVVTPGSVDISPTSVASQEAFGDASVDVGGIGLLPSGIPSGEAFGDAEVSTGEVDVSPGGIPSAEDFGSATVSSGAIGLAPDGIASSESFGDADVSVGAVDVSPVGIASSETFGVMVLDATYGIQPTGIDSGEVVDGPQVDVGVVDVAPSGIPSEEALGSPAVLLDQSIVAPSIDSEETLGDLVVESTYTIAPGGITSSEAFGTMLLDTGAAIVDPGGIPSEEAFGTTVVAKVYFDVDTGMTSTVTVEPALSCTITVPSLTCLTTRSEITASIGTDPK